MRSWPWECVVDLGERVTGLGERVLGLEQCVLGGIDTSERPPVRVNGSTAGLNRLCMFPDLLWIILQPSYLSYVLQSNGNRCAYDCSRCCWRIWRRRRTVGLFDPSSADTVRPLLWSSSTADHQHRRHERKPHQAQCTANTRQTLININKQQCVCARVCVWVDACALCSLHLFRRILAPLSPSDQ